MKTAETFTCYLCKKDKPLKDRALPCAYTERFGHYVCRDCCEACARSEPFPCKQYTRRRRNEQRRAKSTKEDKQ